jgi:hypothetical protein
MALCNKCGEDHLTSDYCLPLNNGIIGFKINLLMIPKWYRRLKRYLQERKNG